MNFTPNEDTEKLLRSMWFGFTDKSFDAKGKQWSFTGSPYISKVGGNGADSVVFDGSTTISASFSGLNFQNTQINFDLQLAVRGGTILNCADFKLSTDANGNIFLNSNTVTSTWNLAPNVRNNFSVRFQYASANRSTTFYVYFNGNSPSIASGSLENSSKQVSAINLTIGEGLKGFISNFSVVTNGNTISQF